MPAYGHLGADLGRDACEPGIHLRAERVDTHHHDDRDADDQQAILDDVLTLVLADEAVDEQLDGLHCLLAPLSWCAVCEPRTHSVVPAPAGLVAGTWPRASLPNHFLVASPWGGAQPNRPLAPGGRSSTHLLVRFGGPPGEADQRQAVGDAEAWTRRRRPV